ncbi:MAG: DUF308 domain-containing protein [Caulobacteraceae bacterium]
MVEGLALVVLGAAAAVLPQAPGVAAAFVFGWALIASGALGFASMVGASGHVHVTWSAISSLVALVVGAVVLWRPFMGASALSLLIAAYLFVDAVAVWGLSLDQRRRGGRGWFWLVAAAAIDMLLALVIVLSGPLGDVRLLGFVIGIDLVAGGAAMVALGFGARRLS